MKVKQCYSQEMTWMEKRHFFKQRRLERRELLGLPNYLTYGRIVLVPVVAALMMTINDLDGRFVPWDKLASVLATLFFIVAAVSDMVDGHYARKYNFSSSFGRFIDPLADKLLTIVVLILLIPLHRIPAWIVAILICRDMIVTSLRAMAADEGVIIAASQWGKYKTTIQNFSVGALILHYPLWGVEVRSVGNILLAFTFVISIGSGIHYGYCFFSELFSRKEPTSNE
ncbi:MAG: CDP-diacylglycerol--glycerol-3-phosphate 3-phosphatidyltransferase [bacterium]|nr:CDP-diacylglycerol--glycerol-3-phosphate 3-phosphatidyltransferase [bacterium]